jgi:hypothetical protein
MPANESAGLRHAAPDEPARLRNFMPGDHSGAGTVLCYNRAPVAELHLSLV